MELVVLFALEVIKKLMISLGDLLVVCYLAVSCHIPIWLGWRAHYRTAGSTNNLKMLLYNKSG